LEDTHGEEEEDTHGEEEDTMGMVVDD